MKETLIYFILILMSACSGIQQIQSKPSTGTGVIQKIPARVDLELPDENGFENGATPQLIPNEETVRLGERGGDIFTPVEDSTTIGQGISKKLRIGISLGPGLYRTINYVSLLKYLERQNLGPQVITGTGFGAIVAAMYACGMTPEVIEWNFYRYFKEKRDYRPYESEWLEEVDNLLLETFKNKTLESTTKRFYITLYSSKTKKTYYFDKGNIRDLLILNLKLSNSVDPRKAVLQYTTAFEHEVFNAALMKRLGVDFTIGADVLGANFDFQNSNEYLIGIFGKAAGRISLEKKKFDYFYSIPLQKTSLDSTEKGAFYLLKTQEYVEEQSSKLKKLIQQKMILSTKPAE